MAAVDTSRLSAADKRRLVASLHEREIERCAASFEHFFLTYVKTKDEHDRTRPVKSIPDKAYLRFLAREFQHGPDVIYVAKSRQLMVSWVLSALTVWTILFRPHSLVCFQSKKEDDAASMLYKDGPGVGRASFIMANLPEWLQICVVMDTEGNKRNVRYPLNQQTFSYGQITMPNGSQAVALAQGAAQVESKVPTLFISDESSLQDEWRASWAAAMPCVDGGGRALAVATMRLPSAYGDEIAPCDDVDPDDTMRGIARFTTAGGGYGLRVHYSADPMKDPATEEGAKWYASATVRMPQGALGADWQAHYEISPAAIAGTRVVPYWDAIEEKVRLPRQLLPEARVRSMRIDAGFDYGARNDSVLLVFANDYEGNRYAVWEMCVPGNEVGGIAGLAKLMRACPYFAQVNGRIQADPTIWNKDQNTTSGLISKAQIFEQHGVRMVKARTNGREADDIFVNRLHGSYFAGYDEPGFIPRLFISEDCPALLRCMGRLRYADFKGAAAELNAHKEQIIGKGVDPFDAAKYAEVAAPAPPVFMGEGIRKAGSFNYLLDLTRRELSKTAGVVIGSITRP